MPHLHVLVHKVICCCIFLQVARPIRVILDRWIYEGELDDLYNEVQCGHLANLNLKSVGFLSAVTYLVLRLTSS